MNSIDSISENLYEESSSLPNIESVFSSGVFHVGETGRVGVEFATDGGSFEGELGIFSIEGLQAFEPDSEAFVREAMRRVLSGTEGHIVISDREDAAKFVSGEGGIRNDGVYRGVREFELPAESAFGVVLVPDGQVEEVFANPTVEGKKVPLFSLATDAEGDRLAFGQIADINGAGYTFAIEDLWVGRSDLDYNDVIFRLTGATGDAPYLSEVIPPEKDWRASAVGREIIDYINHPENYPEPEPPNPAPVGNSDPEPGDPQTGNPKPEPEEPDPEPGRVSPANSQPLVGFIGDRVAVAHPDLERDRIHLGADFLAGDADPTIAPEDDGGNGTFLLGLVGATRDNALGIDGINDEAPLWAGAADAETWAASLQEFVGELAASERTHGIVYLGFPFTDADGNPREQLTIAERAAIEAARQQGIVLVVPTGDRNGTPSVLAQASQEFDNIVAAGSADVLANDRADYSNYGPGLDLIADGGTPDDPVSSIASDGLGSGIGTAIAAAQVAGALSRVWAENPALNYQQAIAAIESSATDLGVPGPDVETGAGLLDLEAALAVARETAGEPLNPAPIVIPSEDFVFAPAPIDLGAPLGPPTTLANGAARQFFERGVAIDGIAVGEDLYRAYDRQGRWDGPLGLPVGVAIDRGNGFIEQPFEGGHIIDGGGGAVAYLFPEAIADGLPEELPPTPYSPDTLLVKVAQTATAAEIQELVDGVGARRSVRLVPTDGAIDTPVEQWLVFEFELGADLRQTRLSLLENPRVEAVDLDHYFQVPNDPQFGEQWHLEVIGAPDAWRVQRGSRDVTVAIIDTGIDYTHEDLAANIWTNAAEIAGNGIDDDENGYIDDVRGWDFFNDSNDPQDATTHGTLVAGVVGAVGNNSLGVSGVSPEVSLLPLRAATPNGYLNLRSLVAAIAYAVDKDADIINASWGDHIVPDLNSLYDAVARANDADVLFVAAAGNSGLDSDVYPLYPASFDLPNVISVAATDRTDRLWTKSNYGAKSVDLGAPGQEILSTLPDNLYETKSGTSLAAPQVAGAAALLLAQQPALTAVELKQALLDRARPVEDLQGRTASGSILNLANNNAAIPDTIHVDSFADNIINGDSQTTLREAIIATNTRGTTDPGATTTIVLGEGAFYLALEGTDEDAAQTGDLDITSNIIIRGAGADRTTIDADFIDRVFHVLESGDLTLEGVTIAGGDTFGGTKPLGGGILNDGNLRVSSTTISDNFAESGGGIYNTGTLEVTDGSTITGNTVDERGGGIDNRGGTVAIADATISNNQATFNSRGIGGGINSVGGSLTVNNATIADNTAGFVGGGIANDGGSLTVTNATTIAGNTARTSEGGGIYNKDAAIAVTDSTFANNTANVSGGALANRNESNGSNINDTIINNSISEGSNGSNDIANTSGSGSDTIVGGANDDYISGGAGEDSLNGSDGNDTVSFQNDEYAVKFSLSEGMAEFVDAAGDTVFVETAINFENADGTPFDDSLTGSGDRNILRGFGGDDTLIGGEANEILEGGRGSDILEGGDGNDFISGEFGDDTLVGGAGEDILAGDSGDDLFLIDEGATNAQGDGADRVSNFTSGSDRVWFSIDLTGGLDYSDLNFSEGEDVTGATGFAEGKGGIAVNTTNGNVYITGYEGGTVPVLQLPLNIDLTNLTLEDFSFFDPVDRTEIALADTGSGGELIVGTPDPDTLEGSDGNDTILGLGDNDWLDGGEGDDSLNGGEGEDTIVSGGNGNAVLNGDSGNDILNSGNGNDVLNGGDGNDTLHGGLAGSDFLDGGSGDDVVSSEAGSDVLNGGSGNDTLFGGSGGDALNGGDGNDTLSGGSGSDILNGGSGFNLLGGGSELEGDRFDLDINGFAEIADFQPGIDLIGLPSELPFSSLTIQSDANANTLIHNGTSVFARLNFVSASDVTASSFQAI